MAVVKKISSLVMEAMAYGWESCINAYQVGGVLQSFGFTLMRFDDGHGEGAQLGS